MSSPLPTLRQVNEKVRNALLRFQPELQRCSSILPGELLSLRAALLRARACLHEVDANSFPDSFAARENATALAEEVRQYRANLEKLQHILPDLHLRLLAERVRLRKAQRHIAAAAAWAGANKKTLPK